MTRCPLLACAGFLALSLGCGGGPPPLFEALQPARTGIEFRNDLPVRADLNIITYLNYYNGGGVAAGDLDGDGLPDLYFTSNLGPDRLYRNLGDFRFEDVTERAGVGKDQGWTSGVTMADVNGDGHLDIYVSSVSHLTLRGRNILYLNDGDGTFTDRTAELGLEHAGYSTQAAFFDYDGDGDLDAYLLNHSTHEQRGRVFNPQRADRAPLVGDRLFRNDGGRFVDVSAAAGIFGGVEGYGLGVVASDLNGDGCPDLFIANDFHENDFLYRNDCDGTFTETIASATGHTSFASMGVDAADFDNDGRPDLAVLDMLPARENVRRRSAGPDDVNTQQLKLELGYHPQLARNTLQLNRGRGRFSDVAHLAGVEATDWSWAPLFADLDNDGWKDLLVTNGIVHRPNDLDYIGFVSDRSIQAALLTGLGEDLLRTLLDKMPRVPIPNHAFRNNRDLTFTDMAEAWGLAQPGFSTGAAYVDLDNDGALDLVLNNIDAPAGIYRNRARDRTGNHSLTVRLVGEGGNRDGIGARILVVAGGLRQLVEQMPTRGFQSSVDPRPHVGLGAAAVADSVVVVWPDRRFQVLTGVPADRLLEVRQSEASGSYPVAGNRPALFESVPGALGIGYVHRENAFFDYTREPLIPHQVSTEGPALAVGDVDGDGLDDVFLGGAKWQAAELWLQTRAGGFRRAPVPDFQADSLAEDVDAALFDADGDGDLDLYVVSGGNEFWDEQEPLLDRLYRNDGRGGLRRDREALPAIHANGCCVAPSDVDGDGDLDLFVGGRVESRRYGAAPRSALLRNDGGRFRDATAELAPELERVGMVTGAAWADVDGDGAPDLVVVGEWMPARVFGNQGGRLRDRTGSTGLAAATGWWRSVAVADLQGDGRPDLVLGNLGLNSSLRASAAAPVRLHLIDFDGDGGATALPSYARNGTRYPLADRDALLRALPSLRERFPTYASFGESTLDDILPPAAGGTVLEASTFASAVALNQGGGRFELRPLPTAAQLAPVGAVLPADLDGDGRLDLLVAGNLFGVPPARGRYDASYGLLLRGDGAGGLAPVDLEDSGIEVVGQVRRLALLRTAGGGTAIVAARNTDSLAVLRPRAYTRP